jgi:hypothetical protein
LLEILKIIKTCKSCAGESPGPIHAHTELHFKYFGKAQHWLAKTTKRHENAQKTASSNPKVVTGNYALRKVSYYSLRKKVWDCLGDFFCFFDLIAHLCKSVWGPPSLPMAQY